MDQQKGFDFKALEFHLQGQKVGIDSIIRITLINTCFNNGLLPLKVDVHNPTNSLLSESFQVGLEIPFTCIKSQVCDYIIKGNGAKLKLADVTSIFSNGWKSVLFDFKVKREEMFEDKPFPIVLRVLRKNDSYDIPFQISLALGYTE